jgi:hypothetical protein
VNPGGVVDKKAKKKKVNPHATPSTIATPHSVILHAECDFHTQKCNFDTYECDYNTLSVISTRKSVISTRTRLVSTRKVRFPHAECDFTCRL